MKQRILSAFLICLVASSSRAVEGVRFAFDVFQRDTVLAKDVRIYSDTALVARGIPAAGFMAVMSVELRVAEADSTGVSYSVHVVTTSRPAATSGREIKSEYGLPLQISGLSGKNRSIYKLVVKPLKREKIAEGNCVIAQSSMELFKHDPTAHADIYFQPNTMGDYYWNLTKSLFESEYDEFDQQIRFTAPGKHAIYLCPCPIASVIWDDRYGQVIDPTRGTSFVLMAPGTNTADPFAMLALAIYRQYGYAPAFLVDGFANIGSAALDRAKSMQSEGKALAIQPLLDSHAYYTGDASSHDAVSAAFVKYLIARYSLDKFLKVYAAADDLNLRVTLESVYEKPIAALEKEFGEWVQMSAVSLRQYEYCSNRAEAMFDYAAQKKYALKMKALMSSRPDSLRTYYLLPRAAFNNGDYYTAADAQRVFLALDTNAANWVALAGYQMMNGVYDSARTDLERGLQSDTSQVLIRMNLGLCDLFAGDTIAAEEKLLEVARVGEAGSVESRVLLGHLFLKSREQAERAKAVPIFQEAVRSYEERLRSHEVSPVEQLWLGMAYLGLDDQSNALGSLQLADFVETRPFYRGMIALWLGKAADLRGEREVAKQHYAAVLSGASAHYTQVEARHYLTTPYAQ